MLYVSYTPKRSCSSQKSVCYVSLKIRYRNYDSLPNARANYKRVIVFWNFFTTETKYNICSTKCVSFTLQWHLTGQFSVDTSLYRFIDISSSCCHDVIVQIKSRDFPVGVTRLILSTGCWAYLSSQQNSCL